MKKNLGIFNTDNDSRTSSYVEKSDSLTHGKLFDFFERDPHGNLDYSENKMSQVRSYWNVVYLYNTLSIIKVRYNESVKQRKPKIYKP